MKLTRIDLNSWIFYFADKTILVDPWLVDPLVVGAPWLFKAYHTVPPIYTPTSLPSVDLILLSQGLDDHCHQPTLKQLDRAIPVVASATAAKTVRRLGYTRVTELAPWQTFHLDALQITAVRGAEIQPGQVENGYYLIDAGRSIRLYYEPHQAAAAEVKARLGGVTVAIAPIVGQIFPLLGQVIMGPEQALQLAQIVQPRYYVPTTLGDIQATGLLPGLIKTVGSIPEFRDRLLASGLETQLLLPAPGETLEIAA